MRSWCLLHPALGVGTSGSPTLCMWRVVPCASVLSCGSRCTIPVLIYSTFDVLCTLTVIWTDVRHILHLLSVSTNCPTATTHTCTRQVQPADRRTTGSEEPTANTELKQPALAAVCVDWGHLTGLSIHAQMRSSTASSCMHTGAAVAICEQAVPVALIKHSSKNFHRPSHALSSAPLAAK